MHEKVHAALLEFEAQANRGRKRKAAIGSPAGPLADRYAAVLQRLGGNAAGAAVGRGARRVGGLLADVPVITWQADLVSARHGLEILALRVRHRGPGARDSALAAVQLAEALERVRRDRMVARGASLLTNPFGVVTSTALRGCATLGAEEGTPVILVRRAHAIASARVAAQPTFLDLWALARVYDACNRPNLALKYVGAAATSAWRAYEALPVDPPAPSRWGRLRDGWRNGGVDGAIDGLGEVLEPSYDGLGPRARWARSRGAALVTAGFVHHGCGRTEAAHQLADRALDLGQTMGHWLHAAALPPGKLNERVTHLKQVGPLDREFYLGARTSDLTIVGYTAGAQAERTARLAGRMWKAVT